MGWLQRWLGWGRGDDPGRARPPPGDGFGAMMWLAERLPPEGFVTLPPSMTYPQPRRFLRFAPTATLDHARWLVSAVAPGQMLGFFDTAWPSVSDPGGFVTAVREAAGPVPDPETAAEARSRWRVQLANHGWHSAWQAIDSDTLAAYLWACRHDLMASPDATLGGGPEADGYRVSTGPAPPGSLAGSVRVGEDAHAPVGRAIARRIVGDVPPTAPNGDAIGPAPGVSW